MRPNAYTKQRTSIAQFGLWCLFAGLVLFPSMGLAAQSLSATVLPKTFLRAYDPVTVVFSEDVGPNQARIEAEGTNWFRVTPTRNGTYKWLDARTLEFRPASPWPAYSRIAITIPKGVKSLQGTTMNAARQLTLRTLLPQPTRVVPANETRDVKDARRITLTFAQKLPTSALRNAISITVRSLSGGIPESGPQKLESRDWWLKEIPKASARNGHSYLILAKRALPKARTIRIQLRLALSGASTQQSTPVWQTQFDTLRPFRITEVKCDKQQATVSWGKTRYPRERALNCGGQTAVPTLIFSRALHTKQNVHRFRQHLRISPTVPGLRLLARGNTIQIKGQYRRDTLYRLVLEGGRSSLRDTQNQPLEHKGKQTFYFFLQQKQPFLRWRLGQGIIEKHGPQMMPIHQRSISQLDIRIHPVSALDRRFWPFPKMALSVFEDTRPPLAGTHSGKASYDYTRHQANESVTSPRVSGLYSRGKRIWQMAISKHIAQLGSPLYSAIVNLPKAPKGQSQTQGLDLSVHMRYLLPWQRAQQGIQAHRQSNQLLIGIRRLNGSSQRTYVRVQVTDLSLTTIETKDNVQFVVTSLKTAGPISGASVLIEGYKHPKDTNWSVLWSGVTNASGMVSLRANSSLKGVPMRIRAKLGNDHLILDPLHPPPALASAHWHSNYYAWLSWLNKRVNKPTSESYRAHLFTERPVYRPSEPVYIKGIVRALKQGKLTIPKASPGLQLTISGPRSRKWNFDNVRLSKTGGLFRKFLDKSAPKGRYSVTLGQYLPTGQTRTLASYSFRIEAYKLPLFEIKLFGKRSVRADKPFRISAVARYFAGGLLVSQPIKWRVSSRTIRYQPAGKEGFHFANQLHYARNRRSRARLVLSKTTMINQRGQGFLRLDPTKNFDLQAREYRIEATVKGPDGRTVTGSRRIRVLPPFAVGVKVANRFRLTPGTIQAQLLAVGIKGNHIEGQTLTAQWFRREWHAHLLQTDFVQGQAKYRTEVVDRPVGTCKIKTLATPVGCSLNAKQGGVYILRVKARDRMGRLQTVSIDLFVRGKQPLMWERSRTNTFKLTLDQKRYQVGQTAQILVRSPFQKARALVILEKPEGVTYTWLAIAKGSGVIKVPIEKGMAPGIRAHVVLMRGRVTLRQVNGLDPGRPKTAFASINLPINPINHKIMLAMKLPSKARPRQWVDVTLNLRNHKGQAIPGEVTLWAVDRAALSLGREGNLRPIKAFIKQRSAMLRIRDSRNLTVGRIPKRADRSGGGGGSSGGMTPIVRRNFKTVAYYNPAIPVGKNGTVTVRFRLPDDLTTYAVRAVATSGSALFGFQAKNVLVRLPVMIQRTLPRFVRQGDKVRTGGMARVVEGPGGLATATMTLQGMSIIGANTKQFALDKTKAVPVRFSMSVPRHRTGNAQVKLQVTRHKDKEADAFQVSLPIRADRRRVYLLKEQRVSSMDSVVSLLSQWPEAIRKGSGRVEILVGTSNETVRTVAAFQSLMEYPFGCTEQQVSRALPLVLYEQTLRSFAAYSLRNKRAKQAIESTLGHLRANMRRDGGFGFWPGSQRSIWLSAYAARLVLEARKAGYSYPIARLNRTLQLVRRSLRSDFGWSTGASRSTAQSEALLTLALAGQHEPAYLRRLAQRSKQLPIYAKTRLLLAMNLDRIRHIKRLARLTKELKGHLSVNATTGQLAIRFYDKSRWFDAALSTQTRTIAGLLEAFATVAPRSNYTNLLKTILMARVTQTGNPRSGPWGNTQDNAQALLALRAVLRSQPTRHPHMKVAFRLQSRVARRSVWSPVQTIAGRQAWQVQFASDAPTGLKVLGVPSGTPMWIRARLSYVPNTAGRKTAALNKGFSIQRNSMVLGSTTRGHRHILLTNKKAVSLQIGDIVEEEVRIISHKAHRHVVVEVPIAAGVEILNPSLLTASPEAKATRANSTTPSHIERLDDRIRFFFDVFPAGIHKLYFRVRALSAGQFTTPAAHAELMYQPTVFGRGPGSTLSIQPATK